MSHILIVEDDTAYGVMIQTLLTRRGFGVERVGSLSAAKKRLGAKTGVDLVLSDLRLPDGDGLSLLEWVKARGAGTAFIVMTSYAEVQNAVLAIKSGADDYIAKPVQPDILLKKIADALGKEGGAAKTARRETKYIEGHSDVSRLMFEHVALVAPTTMSVLIQGATGTGKEYVARRIHQQSRRRDKPFVALDCGAIPREVAASELFGYKSGAFTGADTDKTGAFAAAHGGTLFLDEVGNLNYDVQAQLLRALQERSVRPLGSNEEIPVDIRLICATNDDLRLRVEQGRFREDLYHRICEFSLRVPELKERGSDLLLFADFFVRQANEELERDVEGFDAAAAEKLVAYSWPGNLRELNNVIRQATLLAKGRRIGAAEIDMVMAPTRPSTLPLRDQTTEKDRIMAALEKAGGNKAQAARLLEVDRKTLYNKMQKYGIS